MHACVRACVLCGGGGGVGGDCVCVCVFVLYVRLCMHVYVSGVCACVRVFDSLAVCLSPHGANQQPHTP